MKVRRAYSFDDLVLVPQHSSLGSRDEADISTVLDQWVQLAVPIVSSPMDSVTDAKFALWMALHGGMGIIHRYMSPEDQAEQVLWWHKQANVKYGFTEAKIGVSIGASEEHEQRAKVILDAKPDLVAVDIAHGDSARGLAIIRYLRKLARNGIVIVSGNVATPAGGRRVAEAGADIIRVGLGAGSVCTTRVVAGAGVPQLTAIADIYRDIGGYPIIADGGVKSTGDIVKAMAAGAAAVMCGSLLANYAETPGEFYRGMASPEALTDYKGTAATAEGTMKLKARLTPDQTEAAWAQLVGGIKQGFAYQGARNVYELRDNAEWMEVTTRGYLEGTPHGVTE